MAAAARAVSQVGTSTSDGMLASTTSPESNLFGTARRTWVVETDESEQRDCALCVVTCCPVC